MEVFLSKFTLRIFKKQYLQWKDIWKRGAFTNENKVKQKEESDESEIAAEFIESFDELNSS